MGNAFNPNLNINDPLAEIIEAENTLREFGAASAAMEFHAEQDEGQTEEIAKAEEAHRLTEHEQLLHDRIAELEAQLASQRAASATGAAQATITSTNLNDDCSEIVEPEPVSEVADGDESESDESDSDESDSDGSDSDESDSDESDGDVLDDDELDDDELDDENRNAEEPTGEADAETTETADQEELAEPDWGILDDYLDQPQAPPEPTGPMVTLQHRIPRPTVNAWEPAKEDVINVKVPKAEVFPSAAQPYTVAEESISLPEGVSGNYQIASTRAMLSENTVYVNWRLNSATRPNSWF